MTTPFPFVAGQVLTAAQLNDITNLPINDQTASYVLVVGDAGKRVIMNNASATTITVNNNVFTTGDTIFIANKGAGTTTVTAGAGVTVNTAGSLAVAQHGGGTLVALSASTFTFFSGGAIPAANFSNTATGTYSSGGFSYKYVTFTASGTLTTTRAGFADILVVGGGGGGGNGAGGGAGGHLYATDVYVPVGTLTVTVGAGGAAVFQGVTSRVGNYFSPGGGSGVETNGNAGGSGRGGASATGVGGAGVTDLGNAGGNGATQAGGGGGGAGAVGGNAPSSQNGGTGGAGLSNSITGSAVARAGGGGGSGPTSAGTASDGGGAGNVNTGSNGTANTGGGGGGGWNVVSGAGGSGVVIVRVKV